MKKTRIKVTADDIQSLPKGRTDWHKFDATTEVDIALHAVEDDAQAALEAARYAQRIRKRLGMTQMEFSSFLDVPLDTIRNWEQGRRSPTGAAKTLLKILSNSPELALAALR